jgi:hypothetical protein
MKKILLINKNNNDQYVIFLSKNYEDDYVYYTRYYKRKNGRTIGNWRGIGWYTTTSHAIRGFKRYFKNKQFVVIKNNKTMKNIENLLNSKNFDDYASKIKENIFIRIQHCPKHGNTKHSYCSLTGLSICFECLKERRFSPPKEENKNG